MRRLLVKLGILKEAEPSTDPVDGADSPEILSRHNIVPGSEFSHTINICGASSKKMRTLHDFMSEHSRLFSLYYINKNEAPTSGYSHTPLNEHCLPVWKVEYRELLIKHAHFYGLKVFKLRDVWVIARCFDCEKCPRRLECLGEEY